MERALAAWLAAAADGKGRVGAARAAAEASAAEANRLRHAAAEDSGARACNPAPNDAAGTTSRDTSPRRARRAPRIGKWAVCD